MNNQTRNSRRLEYGPTSPVESHRGERAGIIIDVVVPILQAFVVGILTACVVIAFVNLVYNAGEFPFWIGSGIISLAAFLWILKVQYSMGIEILDLITAFLMALLAGFFCWAFARVATWARRTWLSMWTLAAFVFLLSFFLHLELTLLQRLGQPWQFQRQAIWGAIRTLAEYWGKRERKPTRAAPIAHTGRETQPDPSPYSMPPEKTVLEMFLELARDYDTLARDDSDKGQGLMGKQKSNGKRLTRTEWQNSINWLVEYNYIESGGSGYQWKQGASAQLALESITHPPTR